MKMNKRFSAYIFDLDGTLLDSMGVWEQVDIKFLSSRGFAVPPDYVEIVSSCSFKEAAEYTIERFGLSESVEDLRREWNSLAVYEYGNTVQLKPYAKEYLMEIKAKGAKLAIATALPTELYTPALRNHGIFDLFDAICSADEVAGGKTRPDVFLLAAERLSVSPSDCVVFEDLFAAVKSAKSVGMSVYAVYDEYSSGHFKEMEAVADGVIYDFRDAPR